MLPHELFECLKLRNEFRIRHSLDQHLSSTLDIRTVPSAVANFFTIHLYAYLCMYIYIGLHIFKYTYVLMHIYVRNMPVIRMYKCICVRIRTYNVCERTRVYVCMTVCFFIYVSKVK